MNGIELLIVNAPTVTQRHHEALRWLNQNWDMAPDKYVLLTGLARLLPDPDVTEKLGKEIIPEQVMKVYAYATGGEVFDPLTPADKILPLINDECNRRASKIREEEKASLADVKSGIKTPEDAKVRIMELSRGRAALAAKRFRSFEFLYEERECSVLDAFTEAMQILD